MTWSNNTEDNSFPEVIRPRKSVFPVDIGNKMYIVRREFRLQISRDVGRLLQMKCFNSPVHDICLELNLNK